MWCICLAISGMCSQTVTPSALVEMGLNGPPVGAPGLRSQMSMLLGPPPIQSMIAALCRFLRSVALAIRVLVNAAAGAAIAAHMVLHFGSLSRSTLIGLNPAWLPLPGVASWLFGPAAKLAALNPLSAWATAKMAAKPGAVAEWIARTGSHLDAQGVDLYTRVLSDSGHVHGVLSMMAAWRLKPLAERLHEIRNPVRLLIGAQDLTVPPALAHEACQRLPQALQHTQPGLGHLAHEQDPDSTVQHLLKWCAEN